MKNKDLLDFVKKLKKQRGKEYMKIFFSFQKLFAGYFDYQADVYIKQLTKFPYMLNEKFSNKEFNNKIRQLLQQAFSLGAEEKKEELNKDFIRIGEKAKSITVNNKEILNYVKAHTGELIAQVDKTTQKEVNYLVQKSLLEGWTMDELTEKIKEKFKKYSYTRSALIAHMEIAQAFSVGSKTMIDKFSEKTNIQGWKRAKTQQDSLVRPSHKANEMDGWIPKDQVYSGTGTLHAPHGFFCRCDDIYSMIKPEDVIIDENGYKKEWIKNFYLATKLDKNLITDEERYIQKEYAMTDEEVLAIKHWTSGGYKTLYNGFYKADTSFKYQAVIKFFMSGLNKMPSIKGRFYTGEKRLKVNNLKVGYVFHFPSFTSTSESLEKAKSFADTKIIFVVDTEHGKEVKLFAVQKKEKEILIMPRNIFIITKIIEKNGYKFVYIKDL